MTKPDDWILARWERNGFPMTIRMAAAYRGLGAIPGYEHKVIVVVTLRDPKPSGQPADGEYDDLKMVELSICRMLEAENEALCVLAITGCGTRDLIFYTRDPEATKERLDRARTAVTSHSFDAAIEPDADWELFGYFDKALAKSA